MIEKHPATVRAISATLIDEWREDEFILIRTDDTPQLISPTGTSIQAALTQLSSIRLKGRSALRDGVALAIAQLRGALHDDKAIVVVSDGIDNASRTTQQAILASARQNRIRLFTIALYGSAYLTTQRSDDFAAYDLLSTLARKTGRLYVPVHYPGSPEKALRKVAAAIRTRP